MKLSIRDWSLPDYAALGLVLTVSYLSLFASPHPLPDWCESHAFVFMLSLLGGGLVCFFLNQTRLTFIAFAGCALFACVLNERSGLLYSQSPPSRTDALQLRIGAFRPPAEAAQLDRFLRSLSETDAHVLVLEDLSLAWLPRIHHFLEPLGYTSFQFEPDRQRHLAQAVYSRLPLSVKGFTGEDGAAGLIGRFHLGNLTDSINDVHLIFLSHLPHTRVLSDTASALTRAARRLSRDNTPLLAIGCLPVAPWARKLWRFKQQTALLDSHPAIKPASRQGRLAFFTPPEAHILYSNHFKCVSFETVSGDAGILGVYQLLIRPNRSST